MILSTIGVHESVSGETTPERICAQLPGIDAVTRVVRDGDEASR